MIPDCPVSDVVPGQSVMQYQDTMDMVCAGTCILTATPWHMVLGQAGGSGPLLLPDSAFWPVHLHMGRMQP